MTIFKLNFLQKHCVCLLFLTAMLLSAGCNKDKEVSAYLNVEASIELSPEAETRLVAVETNDLDYYVSWNGAEWGSVTRVKDGFNLTVSENLSSEERDATITVLTSKGMAEKTVYVTQKGSSSTLTVSEDNITFTGAVNTKLLLIESNSLLTWTYTIDNIEGNWLTVVADNQKNTLLVSAAELSIDKSFRTATITIRQGDDVKRVSVKQQSMKYLIPFLDFSKPVGHFIEVEKLRGIEVTQINWRVNYDFSTPSPKFPRLFMTTGNISSLFMTHINAFAVHDSIFDNPELRLYLKSEGFDYVFSDSDRYLDLYWNENINIQAAINRNPFFVENNNTHIEYSPQVARPDKENGQIFQYPTMVSTTNNLITDWTITRSYVKSWEGLRGSIVEYDGSIGYSVFPQGDDICYQREYFFDENGLLIRTAQFIPDINMAFRRIGMTQSESKSYPICDSWVLTDEFKGLLSKEGYIYDKYEPMNGFYYKNAAKGNNLRIVVNYYKELLGYSDTPVIGLFIEKQ